MLKTAADQAGASQQQLSSNNSSSSSSSLPASQQVQRIPYNRGGPAGMHLPSAALSTSAADLVGYSWQAAAAATAGVAAEIVLGASAAWDPPFPVPDARGVAKPAGGLLGW